MILPEPLIGAVCGVQFPSIQFCAWESCEKNAELLYWVYQKNSKDSTPKNGSETKKTRDKTRFGNVVDLLILIPKNMAVNQYRK